MVLSRSMEDRLTNLYKQGGLRGRLVSGRGQEAIPVGSAMTLRDGDVIAPVHRDLGAHLIRGTEPIALFRSYLGRASGLSQGRDSDVHMGDWSKGVYPMVSHLPDSWPVVGGIAFGFHLDGSERVAMAYCGDGAMSTGTWHESVNFAAVFDLPIVYILEDNQYAYSTPTAEAEPPRAPGRPGRRLRHPRRDRRRQRRRGRVGGLHRGGGPGPGR